MQPVGATEELLAVVRQFPNGGALVLGNWSVGIQGVAVQASSRAGRARK